ARRRHAPAPGHRRPPPAPARAPLHAGRGGVPVAPRCPRGVAVSPRSSLRAPARRYRASRRLRAGRIFERVLRRQLQLARAGLVPGELSADRVAAEVPLLLRRRAHGGVPDGLEQTARPLARRRRALAAADPHLPARRGRAAARLRGYREVPARSPLARPDPLLRVLPRRQRGRDRRRSSDGLDRHRREAPPAERRALSARGQRLPLPFSPRFGYFLGESAASRSSGDPASSLERRVKLRRYGQRPKAGIVPPRERRG